MEKTPVFIINGFLDSGKTTFINTIIMNDGFHNTGNTLLIVLESGEVEYNEKFLYDKFKTIVHIGKVENLKEIIKTKKIKRVIIERNAMTDEDLFFDNSLEIAQVITIIETNSFEMLYANIKQKMAEMIRTANIVIFNRIDDKMDKLLSYKRNLMLLNNEADYIFQDSKGQLIDKLTDELPYDLNAEIIDVKDDDYGIFFSDSFDNRERYENKKVSLNIMTYINEGEVVLGRLAMTCCENDITLLGFITDLKGNFENSEWLNIVAKIEYEKITDVIEPVLKVLEYKKIEKIKNALVNF